MEPSSICLRCQAISQQFHLFSCGHTICLQCTARIIFFNHFKEVSNQEHILLECKCKLGTFSIPVMNIRQLLHKPNTSTCISHKASSKFHCMKCENWLCERCLEIHKEINPHHQVTDGRISFAKCYYHEGQLKDLFCHDCQESICQLCVRGAKHSSHKAQSIVEYANQLRAAIPSTDISAQINRIEQVRINFQTHFETVLALTFEQFHKIVKLLEEYKVMYTRKMRQAYERADILINLIKLIYSDLLECQTTLDINILKDMSTINMEKIQLELKDETGSKLEEIKEKIKDMESCFNNLRIQPVEAAWSQTFWSNSLSLTGHKNSVLSLIQLQDGRIASGSADNKIKIWEGNEKEFKNTFTLTGHNNWVWALIQLRDGRIVSGGGDRVIKVWEPWDKDFKNSLTVSGHGYSVLSLVQLKDGRVASGSGDYKIKIWEVTEKNFKNILTLAGHSSYVCSLLQLKDDRIASGSADFTIKVWVMNDKDFMNSLTLSGHSQSVWSLVQLSDGRIASASGDKTIKIWVVNDKDFKNTLTLTGHSESVRSLIKLKDGRIASGSYDKAIKIWEVKENDFQNTSTLCGHSESTWSLLQLKDGSIASGSSDKTIKIWK